jgi:hypothetical protein
MGQFNPADLLEFFIRDRVYRLDWIFPGRNSDLLINTGAPDAQHQPERRCRKQQHDTKEQER